MPLRHACEPPRALSRRARGAIVPAPVDYAIAAGNDKRRPRRRRAGDGAASAGTQGTGASKPSLSRSLKAAGTGITVIDSLSGDSMPRAEYDAIA